MNSLAQLYLNDKDIDVRWSNVKEDFWGDLKREQALTLSRLLTTTMEIQVQDLIGAQRYTRMRERPTYRNGYRYRSLLTCFGHLSKVAVPRVRSGRITFRCFDAYQRRAADIDGTILNMFLAGVSTRRVQEVAQPLFGSNMLSASTVSAITKTLQEHVNQYHARKLPDDYIYLIADGVYLNVKNPIWGKRRCILVVYGIRSNGIRDIIDFQLAPHGESELAWQNFLWQIYYRGLEGKHLRLAVRDGHKGLKNALATVYPHVPQQPCWAHKLRNVANKLPKKFQALCINQARDIYSASGYSVALKAFKSWARTWQPLTPKAVACLNEDIFDLLHFFQEPEPMRKKLRTSNIIERCFREVRRRTRTMSCFNNQDSVHRIIFAIFYRQNSLWEKKPLKEITHSS